MKVILQFHSKQKTKALLKDVYIGGHRYSIDEATIDKLQVDKQVVFLVLEMINSLPRREQLALSLRYGITAKPLEVQEIAKRIAKMSDPNLH